MLKILGILGVILAIGLVLSVTYGCAPREDQYWGRISKEIK